MPFEEFEAIKTENDLMSFFQKYFPDSIPLIGAQNLKEEYFRNPKGSMVSIKVRVGRLHFIGLGIVCTKFRTRGLNINLFDLIFIVHTVQLQRTRHNYRRCRSLHGTVLWARNELWL